MCEKCIKGVEKRKVGERGLLLTILRAHALLCPEGHARGRGETSGGRELTADSRLCDVSARAK